jgi:hypothetical protein
MASKKHGMRIKRGKAPFASPLYVDFSISLSGGGCCGANTVSFRYTGKVPEIKTKPGEIPAALRALADTLEGVQNAKGDPAATEAILNELKKKAWDAGVATGKPRKSGKSRKL